MSEEVGGGDSELFIGPSGPYDFGQVESGQTKDIILGLSNLGPNSLQISGVAFSNGNFSLITATPITVAGLSFESMTIRFTAPGGTGVQSGTMSTAHDADVPATPIVTNVTGQVILLGAPGGTGIIDFDPALVDFGTVKVNTDSDCETVIISNTGVGEFTVTALLLQNPTDFDVCVRPVPSIRNIIAPAGTRRRRLETWNRIGTKVHSLMRIVNARFRSQWRQYSVVVGDFPLIVPAGASFQVTVKASPETLGLRTGALQFLTTLGGSTFDVALSVNSVLLIPVGIVQNTDRGLILGYNTSAEVASMERLDPTDFDSSRAGDFTLNGTAWGTEIEKTLARVEFMHENLGLATITATAVARKIDHSTVPPTRTTQTETATAQLGNVDADGEIYSSFANLRVSGQFIELKISRASDGGPVSITQIIPHFEPRGEKVESA